MRFLTELQAEAPADLVCRACPLHLLEPMELPEDLPPAGEKLGSFSPVWRQKMAEAAGASI